MNNHIEAYRKYIDRKMQVNEILTALSTLEGWQFDQNKHVIFCEFKFDNFHETMAFVNAMAWIAHKQNHHPDLKLGYNYCYVSFSTHDLKGVSGKDFISACLINALLDED